MKMLLINPWEGEMFPPPSVGYVAAEARKFSKECDVTCANLNRSLSLLKSSQFDVVGVSFHSFSVRNARTIRRAVSGKTFLTCGGHHPSSSIGEQLLGIGYDQTVKGEGEGSIRRIIDGDRSKILHSLNPYDILDEVPFPEYAGLDFQEANGYPVISSRGCPFSCAFCASAKFWKNKWRARSPANVIEEVCLRMKAGAKKWMFEDDNFTLNPKRASEICDMIREIVVPRYGKVEWQCASRAESLVNEEMVRKMVESGCVKCWVGVESLSQESLDRCGKSTTVEKMSEGISTASRLGLLTYCQFIPGLPGDTRFNIIETVENMKKIRMGGWGANLPWILPDTSIYDKAIKCGFKDSTYLDGGSIIYSYEQSIPTLMAWEKAIRTLNTEAI